MSKNIEILLIPLFVLLPRLVIKGASIGDAIVVASFAALYAYTMYNKTFQPKEINAQMKKEFDDIKTSVAALKIAKSIGR